MSLQACPHEVIRLIIAEISDRSSLLSLSFTSRLLRTAVEPRIYERTEFLNTTIYRPDFPSDVVQLCHRTIVLHKSPCAQLVRHFSIDRSFLKDPSFVLPLINEMLDRFTNLKSFALSAPLDLPPWIFFPCMRLSPPPFTLTRLVWLQSIRDFTTFCNFLSHQPGLTEISILSQPTSQPYHALPLDALPNLAFLRANVEWLHSFPPGSIPALQFFGSSLPFKLVPQWLDPYQALSNLRAIGCAMDTLLLSLLYMTQKSSIRIMPKLEFVELNGMSLNTLQAPNTERLIHEFSLRPIRYLRLPSQLALRDSALGNAASLFARVPTLECVDYHPDSMNHQQWRRALPRLTDILSPPSPDDIAEIRFTRWHRNASACINIALLPRRLDEWELDLGQSQ